MRSEKRLTRRSFFIASGLASTAFIRPIHAAADDLDLVLRNAEILDGTGGPPFHGDIAIRGDRIVAFGKIDAPDAARVIDVAGLHISSGFIDMHSHSDASILACPTADSRVRQGITTECTGNCGSSAAPRALLRGDGAESGQSLREYSETLENVGISVNHALLIGQGSLRANQIGLVDRPMTDAERRGAAQELKRSMRAGAFGLSTGLEYAPGRFTPAEEIHELARIVKRQGGLYASHIRNEEAKLIPAIEEAIEVGRATGVRVQISHLKAAGKPNWPQMEQAIALIEAARAEGIDVMADAYPYTAYSTGLSIFLPDWALDGGAAAMRTRLQSNTDRARLREEVHPRVMSDPGDYDLVVISSVAPQGDPSCVGKNLREIAVLREIEPAEAVLTLLEENHGEVSFVGHGMSEENVARALAHPLVMIGSDGAAMMPPTPGQAVTQPHPRSYGTYPRVLGDYVRERGLLDLPTAIRKMTSLPAERLGLRDRGRIAAGMKADLVVFDTKTVGERSTFSAPHQYPTGIEYVFVNGVAVVEKGEHTAARPGRVLRRS